MRQFQAGYEFILEQMDVHDNDRVTEADFIQFFCDRGVKSLMREFGRRKFVVLIYSTNMTQFRAYLMHIHSYPILLW